MLEHGVLQEKGLERRGRSLAQVRVSPGVVQKHDRGRFGPATQPNVLPKSITLVGKPTRLRELTLGRRTWHSVHPIPKPTTSSKPSGSQRDPGSGSLRRSKDSSSESYSAHETSVLRRRAYNRRRATPPDMFCSACSMRPPHYAMEFRIGFLAHWHGVLAQWPAPNLSESLLLVIPEFPAAHSLAMASCILPLHRSDPGDGQSYGAPTVVRFHPRPRYAKHCCHWASPVIDWGGGSTRPSDEAADCTRILCCAHGFCAVPLDPVLCPRRLVEPSQRLHDMLSYVDVVFDPGPRPKNCGAGFNPLELPLVSMATGK